MELAREIVISWRELRDKLIEHATTIDHPPWEQSPVAGVSLVCHTAVPALSTYTHAVKDKTIMTNKDNMYMQDDAGLSMNRIWPFVIQE